MNEVYTITSDRGDEYKLQFTTDRSGVISDALLDLLAGKGIEVMEVGLARVKGQNVTSHQVLAQIEDCIADLMERHPNVILSFFSDFIHLYRKEHEPFADMIADGPQKDFGKPE